MWFSLGSCEFRRINSSKAMARVRAIEIKQKRVKTYYLVVPDNEIM
jgi:hypothetical protein